MSLRPVWPAYGIRSYVAPWGIPYGEVPSFVSRTPRREEFDYLKGLARSMRKDLEEIEEKIKRIESKKG
jgi:hypothetical protein